MEIPFHNKIYVAEQTEELFFSCESESLGIFRMSTG